MTTQPKPITHKTDLGYTVTLEDPKQLVVTQGIPCIDGGQIRHDGKMVNLMVRYDTKPDLAGKIATWKAEWESYKAAKAAELAKNVPMLKEVEEAQTRAYNEQARYDAEFERMMNTGDSISPKPLNQDILNYAAEMTAYYKRAALYLTAKDYTYSNNSNKYSAGKDAMELIASGGDLETARDILENWSDRYIPVWGK